VSDPARIRASPTTVVPVPIMVIKIEAMRGTRPNAMFVGNTVKQMLKLIVACRSSDAVPECREQGLIRAVLTAK